MDKLNEEFAKNVKIETVNMSEMGENPDAFQMKMTPDAIPNMEKLTGDILAFLQFTELDSTKELIKKSHGTFLHKTTEKFPDIPYSIIKMLMDEDETPQQKSENITKLLNMFGQLDKIKRGEKDMDETFEHFREGLSEEYIYPQYGGKEEFEKKMLRKNKRKEKRQNRKYKSN